MDLDGVPKLTKYLSVVMLFSFIGRCAVWMFLPIFIERHISAVFLVGLVTALPPLVPIFLDIPVSNLVQRLGEKLVILAGLVTLVVPGALYLLAAPVFIVAGKAMEGVSKVLFWNGGWSLSLKLSDPEFESQTASIFLLGINLAFVIGPVFGGYIIASGGFAPLFLIWMGSAGLGVLLYLKLIGADHKGSVVEATEELFRRRTYLEEFGDFRKNFGNVRKPMLLVVLFSSLLSFNWLVIPLLLDSLDAGFVTMGVVFSLAGIPWLVQFFWGNLADRFNPRIVIAGAAAVMVPLMLILSMLENVLLIGAVFIFSKVFLAAFSPSIHSILDANVDEDVESEIIGFFEVAKHSGQAAGPVLAGALASAFSLNASFIGASLVASALLLLALLDF